MKTMSYWAQIFARLKSKTPYFFKTIRKYGYGLTAFGGGFRGYLAASNDTFPVWVDNWCGYIIAFGTACILFSMLPTTDADLAQAVTPKQAAKLEDK